MATSGSTDFNLNSRQIITSALEIVGVLGSGANPSAADADVALRHLNLLLKTWGTRDFLATRTQGTQALTQGVASYVLANVKRVYWVQRRTGGNDTPLTDLSRQEYDELPRKASQGAPNSYYVDQQRTTTTLYLWPAPDAGAAANTTIRYTYQRVMEDADDLNNDVDLPQEWLEALTYNLASRLILPFQMHIADPNGAALVRQTAGELYAALSADDQETASAFFQPAQRY